MWRRDIVLANIRQALPSRWSRKVEELRAIARTNEDVTLGTFLREAELDLEDVYQGTKSWSDLRAAAGLKSNLKVRTNRHFDERVAGCCTSMIGPG